MCFQFRRFTSPVNHNVWFFIAAGAIILILNVPSYLDCKPVSNHYWRQSDCVSLGMNYYSNGMRFFKPEVHNQLSEFGASGRAVGEFPIIYYIHGALYHLFEVTPLVYRSCSLIIFMIGLWCLYRLARLLLNETFKSIALALLIFTTPLIIVYSITPLPEVTALAVSFAGWFLFARYLEEPRTGLLIKSLLLFTLAGLIKITVAANLIILGFILIAEATRLIKWRENAPVFPLPFMAAAGLLVSLSLIAAWYLYAIRYNFEYFNYYFSTHSWPIWNLTKKEIADVWLLFRMEIFRSASSPVINILMIVTGLTLIFNFNKINRLWGWILLMFFSGFILFFTVLFYAMIGRHDYYLIFWVVLIVFSYILMMMTLKRSYPKIYNHFSINLLILLLVIAGIYYGGKELELRMTMNNYGAEYHDWYDAGEWLETIGVKADHKVISLPDETPNYTLSLIDRKGWTFFSNRNLDSAGVASCIKLGAQWLLILEPALDNREYIRPFLGEMAGQRGDMLVYELVLLKEAE